MKKSVVYAVVLVVVSLVAGLVIGLSLARKPRDMRWAGLEGRYHGRFQQNAMRGDKKAEIMQHISYRLKLSESQKEELEKILKTSREQVKEVSSSTREKLLKIKENTNEKIRAVLTPEQREEFDKMILEFKGKLKKFGERRFRPAEGRDEPGSDLR